MSTYTDYKLDFECDVFDIKLSMRCIDGLKNTLIDILAGSDHTTNATWYEHEEHMIELSYLNRGIIFTLWGTSEDFEFCEGVTTEKWKKVFLNGKMIESYCWSWGECDYVKEGLGR